jgi:DNA invertase Pin-like site-specific DNA recombinase
VLHLSQQLASLTSYGVRFIAASQGLDTDASNPSSRLMLTILAGVAEFEREVIKERTLSGMRAAKANGKILGRPRRVFRRDEVVRLRDDQGMSWRAIAKQVGVPVSTLVDAYKCTEIVPSKGPAADTKTKLDRAVA